MGVLYQTLKDLGLLERLQKSRKVVFEGILKTGGKGGANLGEMAGCKLVLVGFNLNEHKLNV